MGTHHTRDAVLGRLVKLLRRVQSLHVGPRVEATRSLVEVRKQIYETSHLLYPIVPVKVMA